jgi:hypothetical protein
MGGLSLAAGGYCWKPCLLLLVVLLAQVLCARLSSSSSSSAVQHLGCQLMCLQEAGAAARAYGGLCSRGSLPGHLLGPLLLLLPTTAAALDLSMGVSWTLLLLLLLLLPRGWLQLQAHSRRVPLQLLHCQQKHPQQLHKMPWMLTIQRQLRSNSNMI